MRKAMRSAWLPVMPIHAANVEMLVALHRLTLEEEGLLFRGLRLAWAARGIGERPAGLPDRVWAALDAAWASIEEARVDAEAMAARRRQQTEAARAAALLNRATKQSDDTLCNRLSNRAILRQKTKDKRQGTTEYLDTAEPLVQDTNSQEVTVLARSRRSRRAPASFSPSDEHRRLAAERDVDLDAELAKFRDHEFAVGKTDWPAAFRNWLRSARARKQHPVDIAIRRFVAGERPEIPIWERLAAEAERGS